MSLLNKLLFVPSVLVTMFSSDHWYDRIDECVIIGAIPSRSTVEKLVSQENVKGILSMNEAFETNSLWYPTERELQDVGVKFKQLPVEDYFGHPTWTQAQEGLLYIKDICSKNGTVYIHCKSGRYRSALMTATYLMQRYNVTPTEAEVTLKQHRKQIWLHDAETAILSDFYFHLWPQKITETTPQTIRVRGRRRVH